MSSRCIWVLLFAMLAASASAAPAYKVVRVDAGGRNLLKDDAWRAMSGSTRAGGIFSCRNESDPSVQRGFWQTVTLNQSVPAPIVAEAWSRAQDVGGSKDADYSLYLDLRYVDGQPLWGQTADFRTGTHGWQRATVKIFPAKPVKQITVNLLLRRHSGAAQFKEPRLSVLRNQPGLAWLDGIAVAPQGKAAGGFLVRDVAKDSDYLRFGNNEAMGLKLDASEHEESNARRITATITDTTGADRAVTLLYVVPLEGDGWQWLSGARRPPTHSDVSEYLDASHFSAGANGMLSRYPFAAAANPGGGRAICLDISHPAFFRVGFSPSAHLLYIAYDLGLTRERPSAAVSFAVYSFPAADGFRGAVDRMYRLFPESFRCRTKQQGLWMPFYRISKVEGWEDFGFAFKEGDDETAWDDRHGILTFRYTEPLTWWMRMPRQMPRTLTAAEAEARRLASAGDRSAQALLTSGYRDEAGRLSGRFRDEPWCDGIVWSMNSSPAIPGDVTDFKNKWNPTIKQKLYGPGRKANLDGEYIDSAEGYVTDELDFDRSHFASAESPLTFSTDEHRPACFRGLIVFDYIRGIARDVHAMHKLMMANSTPSRLCFLVSQLDVLGTETDWNPAGHWRPMDDEDMLYRRIMAGPKPYGFLMNTDFDRFPRELTEKYMKRSLAYGMFPGFFSANAATKQYFSQPALYNRDRELFKKYVPLCRLVAEAGWRPLTHAAGSDPRIHLERFGEQYLTAFNDSRDRRSTTIRLEGLPATSCRELLSGDRRRIDHGTLTLTLGAEDVALLELK